MFVCINVMVLYVFFLTFTLPFSVEFKGKGMIGTAQFFLIAGKLSILTTKIMVFCLDDSDSDSGI